MFHQVDCTIQYIFTRYDNYKRMVNITELPNLVFESQYALDSKVAAFGEHKLT